MVTQRLIVQLFMVICLNLTVLNIKNHLWDLTEFYQNKGYIEVFRTLIEHGADINAVDTTERTPLLVAAMHGNWSELEIFR